MPTNVPRGTPPFSATMVTRVVHELHGETRSATRRNWLRAVTSNVVSKRPDLAEGLLDILNTEPFPSGRDPLEGMSIGEVGVCYEALLASTDPHERKASGQYFTPDDAARFMAQQSESFPPGIWLDPCCGVGNLSWHLAAAQDDPSQFVKENLTLIDRDEIALCSAIALIGSEFLGPSDLPGLAALHKRARRRDFLSRETLPNHDFVIVNPPYARAPKQSEMRTARTHEFFAYFLERVARESRGFIAVTPASYLAAPKFQVLRDVLDDEGHGGRVFVFDNVPDTLFRGYKFGSSNTSNTNFVRAAITVCSPADNTWSTTPIIRWKSVNRSRMFEMAPQLLSPRVIGPAGEWAKIPAALAATWDRLQRFPHTISDLTVKRETEYSLTVAMTPRYYISAAYRDLQRGSKAVLYFTTPEDRDRAALVLNSSIAYLWWRALDGGVNLPRRVLMSTPLPGNEVFDTEMQALAKELRDTEAESITTKLNAGLINENIKRDRELVDRIDRAILGESPDLKVLYSEDMAAPC